ncbi:MAG: M1 family metallopeptidase [Pseudomonadota bacterium]
MTRQRRVTGAGSRVGAALLVLLVLLVLWGLPMSGAAGAVQLGIMLHPETARLEGSMRMVPAELNIEMPQRFQLDPGVQVTGVSSGSAAVSFVHGDDGWLEWREPIASDAELRIDFEARLGSAADAHPGSGYLDPEGGYLPAGAAWYPRLPRMEPLPMRVELQLPAGQRGVVSGSLVEEHADDDTWRGVFAHPAGRALAVASGPWILHSKQMGEVQVRVLFSEPLAQRFASSYLEATAAYIERFAAELGDFPFSSYSVAAIRHPVGMAFSGFTLLGEQVVPLPFIPGTSLGHEVLHSWWGTGVYVAREGGNWSEGLTTFMADYQFAREEGEGRAMRGRWLRDQAALPDARDYPLGHFHGGSSGADRVIGYHRGAMLWVMLEDWIGRDALRAGLRDFYREWRYREADWEDLIRTLNDATEPDLEPFFQQWLERPGVPRLAVQALEVSRDTDGWVVTGSLQQEGVGAPRDLRVPLVVDTEAGQKTAWIRLSDGTRTFRLEARERPVAIALDPDWRMLRELAEGESPAILRRAGLDPELRVVALGAAEPDELMAWLGRVPDPAPANHSGTRVVLGGHAETRGWLEARGLPETPGAVVSELEERGDARAWAVPDADLVVISAENAESRRTLSRALRHRASSSYVLQEQGRVVVSGVWPLQGNWQVLEP